MQTLSSPPRKVLACFALEEERATVQLPGAPEVRTIVTGVGKARAAMRLTMALRDFRPDMVLNVGTAGTVRHAIGDIVVARRFIDRDHERVRLPGLDYKLDFSTAGMPLPMLRSVLSGQSADGRFTVSTGDDFVTDAAGCPADVFDMEAFAEALVCRETGVPFVSVKYVTDIIGRNSIRLWEEKLEDARRALTLFFGNLGQNG